jgi:hypothetical protein
MPEKRLLIFRYLYAAYVTATDLAPGPIADDTLPKLRIQAEPAATTSLLALEPHFSSR